MSFRQVRSFHKRAVAVNSVMTLKQAFATDLENNGAAS